MSLKISSGKVGYLSRSANEKYPLEVGLMVESVMMSRRVSAEEEDVVVIPEE